MVPVSIAEFTAAPFDIVQDLCGDPGAGLVVFLAGNQFMVLPELVSGFLAAHPSAGSVFYETLPPGIVAEQFRRGGLRVGSLELRVKPDVLALSPAMLAALHDAGRVGPPRAYASNDLTLLVRAGNPAGVTGWADLARPGLRVAFPDPATQGIGTLALEAIEATAGPGHRALIEGGKRDAGEVVFTTIHHRQGPAWLADAVVDVAVAWSTEARHHEAADGPFDAVAIPATENRRGVYAASVVTGAPHGQAAASFMEYLCGEEGRAIYAAHGFGPP